MAIERVRIILVEPAGPLNVGSVARIMKNFGLNHLVLVNPQCDPLSAEARQMAVHAQDILDSAISVETLPQALQGCKRAVATTGRIENWEGHLETPRSVLPWLLEQEGQPAALIFGKEDRGLSNEELNYAQRFVRIPTDSSYASLNLATAVGICCYEMAQSEITSENTTTYKYDLAPLDSVEGYYQQLESLLLKIGYLYIHTASSRMIKFRQMYNRAQLQTTEVAMLRGILSQVEWAINNRNHHEKS